MLWSTHADRIVVKPAGEKTVITDEAEAESEAVYGGNQERGEHQRSEGDECQRIGTDWRMARRY